MRSRLSFITSRPIATMTGRWQPYMYAAQSDSMIDTDPTQSRFDPKAITRASRMPPSPPKKKKEGPLIDFNQHPDSYLVLPYGNTDAKPMTNKIKTFISIARWTQFALRLLTVCGAVGVLLCGIFIQGAQDSEGYIMRVPVSDLQQACRNTANSISLVWTSLSACMAYTTCSVTPRRDQQAAPPATTSLRSSPTAVSSRFTSSPFSWPDAMPTCSQEPLDAGGQCSLLMAKRTRC